MTTLEMRTEENTRFLHTSLLAYSTPGSSESIQLPKLELKSFNGDILMFHEFWDLFKATVDAN